MSKVILSILLFSISFHPVHVSITNIEYDEQRGEIALHIRVFKDDLVLAVYHNYEEIIEMDSSTTYIDSLQIGLVEKYLFSFLSLTINDTIPSQLKIENNHIEGNELQLELSCKIHESIEKIDIYNAIFTDLFFDQKNLVIFSCPGIEKGIYFDYRDQKRSIEIKKDEGKL